MKSAIVLGLLGSVLAWAAPAQAQMCGGSHLLYIVRDANGTPIDAAAKSFAFQGSSGRSAWYTARGGSYDIFTSVPAALLAELKGTFSPLRMWSGTCTFTTDATLSVTVAGKTMDLVFRVAYPPTVSDHYFLVDGMPFHEGRFEIALPLGKTRYEFYPAHGWTKK